MTAKTVTVNGVDLTVQFEPSKMKEIVGYYEKSFEGQYTEMWTVDEAVTKEQFDGDIERAKTFIAELEAGKVELHAHVEKVRKKKNNKFWSNSGHDILQLTNISEYFTDFTNAWSVLVFRLEVLNETTCELVLRTRTYTQ